MTSKNLVPKTRLAVFLSSIFHEPLYTLYPILPFLMVKNLGATSFQIVLLTMLKPFASIFSFYWSERLSQKKHSIKLNLLVAGILARLSLCVSMFFDNVWLLILGSTIYMIFWRAGIPAWMEILKRNLPTRKREKYFSIGSMIAYVEGILIGIGFGFMLDNYLYMWKLFYSIAIFFGLIGVIIQSVLKINTESEGSENAIEKNTFWEFLTKPLINCVNLLKERPDFRKFQWSFMFGGFALMIIQPVIPIFFAEVLSISYVDLAIAYSICKGLGFVLTSQIWSRAMSVVPIRLFTSLILIGFAVFPIFIILAKINLLYLYLAYTIYGVAQAGSHLIWHLSGPLFANNDRSTRYSGVNIMFVGVRGFVGPPIGGALASIMGPIFVLCTCSILCFLGILQMMWKVPKRLLRPS